MLEAAIVIFQWVMKREKIKLIKAGYAKLLAIIAVLVETSSEPTKGGSVVFQTSPYS